METLINYLKNVDPGLILETQQLERVLASNWYEFEGVEIESMENWKVLYRMENVVWQPPVLSFSIERHGSYMMGGSRAQMHRWSLNLETKKAEMKVIGYRQLIKRSPNLDVNSMVDEIANIIVNHIEDERIKWYPDGSVRIYIGKLIPAKDTYKQTLIERRKRFKERLQQKLNESGWELVANNYYKPKN